MDKSRHRRAETLLRLLIVLSSIAAGALFLFAALRRLRYPYELEELEGYMVECALRVFHGQTLYPRPSLDFIPDMYPPLYFYAAAAMGKLMGGVGFATLRLTSILSTLGCFAAIYLLVWSEVRKHLPALAAAGLYAGCYPLCEGWFDLGRLDSLFVLLMLVAMLCTRRLPPAIAALAWTLAFQTKQNILPAAVVMLCFNFRSRTRTLVGLATLLVCAGGSVLWMNHATHGWYTFYVFTVPGANSDLLLRQALEYWPRDILRPLALAIFMIVAAAFLTRPSLRSEATRFYISSLALLPLFWIIKSHAGATANTLMPVYALIAVLFGIAFSRLESATLAQGAPRSRLAALLALGACLLQDGAGVYNPGRFAPNAENAKSLDAVMEQLRALPGDAYVAQHPYYAVLAGKPAHADIVSIHDAMRPANPAVRADLQAEMRSALGQHQFSAILLDSDSTTDWLRAMPMVDPGLEGYLPDHARIPCTGPLTRPGWMLASSIASRTCGGR